MNNVDPILLPGPPGVGKTKAVLRHILKDIWRHPIRVIGCYLRAHRSHPCTTDPTDYKGLPMLKDHVNENRE